MERDPSSSPHEEDEWLPANGDVPKILDLRDERTGFELLKQRYEQNTEQYALNSVLALLVLIHETEQALVVGMDSSVLEQKSQPFFDALVHELNEGEDVAFEHLRQRFSFYNECTVEFLVERSRGLVRDKNLFFENFRHMGSEQRATHRERFGDDLLLLKRPAQRYLGEALDKVPLSHEGGDLDGIDEELFKEYLVPFLDEDPSAETPPVDQTDQLGWQVHKRLVIEAHHVFGAFTAPLADA